jgi:hypothetical protein
VRLILAELAKTDLAPGPGISGEAVRMNYGNGFNGRCEYRPRGLENLPRWRSQTRLIPSRTMQNTGIGTGGIWWIIPVSVLSDDEREARGGNWDTSNKRPR